MNSHDTKDLVALKELLALIEKAEALARTLKPANSRSADATIGGYSLSQAAERYRSLFTTVHVAVHNTLPSEER